MSNILSTDNQKPLVLVIDDEMIFFQLVSMICSNYDFEWWDNGVQGIQAIQSNEAAVSLIILDYNLSEGITGLEALESIRSLWPTLPILMWSGHHDVESQAFAKGVTAFIKKPFDPEVLEALIEKLLELSDKKEPI